MSFIIIESIILTPVTNYLDLADNNLELKQCSQNSKPIHPLWSVNHFWLDCPLQSGLVVTAILYICTMPFEQFLSLYIAQWNAYSIRQVSDSASLPNIPGCWACSASWWPSHSTVVEARRIQVAAPQRGHRKLESWRGCFKSNVANLISLSHIKFTLFMKTVLNMLYINYIILYNFRKF